MSEIYSDGDVPNLFDTSNKNEEYFASKPANDLASVCLARARSFFNIQESNQYLELLRRNWAFYQGIFNDGDFVSSHTLGFTGDMGELVTSPVNHYRNIARHVFNMITQNRPTMECRAINTDHKSKAQAVLANSILDYYMRQKELEGYIKDAAEMAIVLGAGFIRAEWNATAGDPYDADPETGESAKQGELEFSNLSPFDVVFDGTKSAWKRDTMDWLIVRTFQNRFNLIAKYPQHKDKIMGIPTETAQNNYRLRIFSNDDSDDIAVYEFYHKKTEAMPNGRYFMFLSSDCPLVDIPLPYREIPIYRISAGEFMGTPYGYSDMFDVYPIQEGINATNSAIQTNQATFAVQNLYVPEDSNINISALQGSLNIITGREMPQALQMCATPKEVFDYYTMQVQQAETISGVNSVTRGDPQASLKSGTALALVQSMSLQFISGLQNNYVKLIEEIGTSIINILKDYAKTPKTLALVGKNDAPLVKEFTSSDIDNIQRVIVSVGNPLARTIAGRVQMAEQMMQMGAITTYDQYFEILETGQIKSMYQAKMNSALLITQENEDFMEGKPCIVDILDDHTQHILEHRSVMSNPDLRKDPVLRKIVQDHIQEHINFLRTAAPDLMNLIGQPSLQPPQMPQMAPEQNPQGPGGMQTPSSQPQSKKGSTRDASIDPAMLAAMGGLPNPGDMIKGQGNGSSNGAILPAPAQPPPIPQ